mmetsp:Transcript_15809/g.61778  ORF Transcript_15809/g.61778 Transcript_15809/m.61778 type:complete len:185 (-) Transcript_15809:1050-1604(-)
MQMELTKENLARLEAETSPPVERELRQFGCRPCGERSWWKEVPTMKPVSRCSKCRTRYDPVPVEQEWGFGKFRCSTCSNVWTNRSAKRSLPQKCRKCGTMVAADSIREPPRGPAVRRSTARHRCAGCRTGACKHRFSPSEVHDSTGSTISALSIGTIASVYGDGADGDDMALVNEVFARVMRIA